MRRIATVVAILALAAPAAAAASDSSCQAYNTQDLCAVANADGPATPTPHATASSGTLPFTGLDVALLAAGGGGLLGAGLIVRRFSTQPQR